MTDDPLSLLVVLLLAETAPPVIDGIATIGLDAGVSLEHNPTGALIEHRGLRIRPQATVVRLADVPVGTITPWRWTVAVDEDVVRGALLRALGRQRAGYPPLRLRA